MTAPEPTAPDSFGHLDAAYVFGALDPDEAARFETHLATCAACAAQVAETRALAGLLADVTAAEVVAEVPDTLLPGLLRKAASERRRQRGLVAALAAVAAACVVTLVVLLWPASTSGSHSRSVALVPRVQSPISATATLIDRPSGTEIALHCHYAATGSENPEKYGLVVYDRSGKPYPLSSWKLDPGQSADFPASTALREDEISHVDVTYQGRTILSATL
ncbi:zf-HC2 domain-containing protein [Jatrophihabitans sp.]|uniref:anti-sigma factor family protein n=1 Tax=Jatrophihabitans sp. TaxID=1932789 RepID=UPI0030C71D3A|nr:putative transrane anti-sigma factor [Jatrophihabitans sp.]